MEHTEPFPAEQQQDEGAECGLPRDYRCHGGLNSRLGLTSPALRPEGDNEEAITAQRAATCLMKEKERSAF